MADLLCVCYDKHLTSSLVHVKSIYVYSYFSKQHFSLQNCEVFYGNGRF